MRAALDRGSKEPKPKMETRLPDLISEMIDSVTASTAASDRFLSRPVIEATLSASSVLFTATSWACSGKFPDIQEVSAPQVKHFPCTARDFILHAGFPKRLALAETLVAASNCGSAVAHATASRVSCPGSRSPLQAG